MLSDQIENIYCIENFTLTVTHALLSQTRRKCTALCSSLETIQVFPSTLTLNQALPFIFHFIPTGRRTRFIPLCCTVRCLSLRLLNSPRISPQARNNSVLSNFEVRTEGSSVCFLVRETLNEGYCISKRYRSLGWSSSDHFHVTVNSSRRC